MGADSFIGFFGIKIRLTRTTKTPLTPLERIQTRVAFMPSAWGLKLIQGV